MGPWQISRNRSQFCFGGVHSGNSAKKQMTSHSPSPSGPSGYSTSSSYCTSCVSGKPSSNAAMYPLHSLSSYACVEHRSYQSRIISSSLLRPSRMPSIPHNSNSTWSAYVIPLSEDVSCLRAGGSRVIASQEPWRPVSRSPWQTASALCSYVFSRRTNQNSLKKPGKEITSQKLHFSSWVLIVFGIT